MQITPMQKKFEKSLGKKKLVDYHDLYVQSDILLLDDVFENFRNMCLEIYELHPAHFLSPPGLASQPALKKTKVKLNILFDIDMLLMLEKCIRERICLSIYQYAKADNKCIKDYDEKTKHYFIMKIQDKWELQQIAFNHSSNIDFKDFANLNKECTTKPYSFLVIATLVSDNPSRKLVMANDGKIRDEKS